MNRIAEKIARIFDVVATSHLRSGALSYGWGANIITNSLIRYSSSFA